MSFEVSQSKIKNWRTCKKAYHYKYILKLTKKFKPMPFLRGDVIHQMLEAHYNREDPWVPYEDLMEEHEKLIRVHHEDYGHLPDFLKMTMKGYFRYYKKEEIEPISVEDEFTFELTKGIFIIGKRDLIAKSQGLKWMVEHKCNNNIPTDSMVPYHNLQSTLYVEAYNRENKKPLDGVMWNYILGKPLPRPKLLKDGTMSKRKSSTTWAIYRDELKKNNLKPKDYLDVKAQLKGNEDLVYQRQLIPVNKCITETIIEDTITTAKEIQKYAGKDTTRNLGRHCDYCEFKKLCTAQLKGLDDNYILKTDYKKRKKNEKGKKEKRNRK